MRIPGRVSGLRYGALMGAVVVVAAAVVTSVATEPGPASAATCGDGIVVLGARGSGAPQSEWGGLGTEVKTAKDALYTDLRSLNSNLRIREQSVIYPANDVKILGAPGGITEYTRGIAQGVDNARSQVRDITRGLDASGPACAGARIILMGFSQGAAVMHRLLRALSPGGIYADANLLKRIGGAVLLADPDKQFNDTSMVFPGLSYFSTGIAQRFQVGSGADRRTLPNEVRDRTYSVCIPLDAVCDAPVGPDLIRFAVGVGIHVNVYRNGPGYASREYGAITALARKLKAALPNVPPTTSTPPSTTTPPTTSTPPSSGTCSAPPAGDPSLVRPPATLGKPYDQIWQIPSLAGCDGGYSFVPTNPNDPVSALGLTPQPIKNGPDGKPVEATPSEFPLAGLRVYGTPTLITGIRTGTLDAVAYSSTLSAPIRFSVCFGVLNDDGSYDCNK